MNMATSSDKIENCEVCGANKAKYTCPKCEVRTCCLECVHIHKRELECNGIRDKTKYKPLKSFTDLDVLSDYRMLEEVGRTVEHLKRDPFRRCTRLISLPMHLHKLQAAALKRKTSLQFMPQHFSRHKNNTTFLNWKTNELYWRIEWIFPQAECTRWITERALESQRLSTLIEEILDPVKSLGNKNDIEELNLRLRLSEKLQFYQAADLSGIKVLLKAEKVAKSELRYYELDVTLTLKENLENRTIIEFPVIYVILKDHSYMYDIIDTDDEDVNNSESNDINVIRRKKRPYNEMKTKGGKDSTINYFFNSDLSDSEDEKPNVRNKTLSNFNIPDYDELVKREL
ncbi:box C/D snoRNA protein 1 [Ceratina calcarata]|uniref:Box C/D snoRNA protein 1 n=1 Tax=Ceratina calcarata TaxID=156304 RepID=A0AAJ7NC88_9HYME|nr:box C/D snoRNA protein 1 [Ceratina calcarata]